jgi:hypothetical protein
MFAKFLGEYKTFYDIKDSETIVAFLNTSTKNKEEEIVFNPNIFLEKI